MNFKFIFFLGSLFLFLGLFWLLLPHAYHEKLTEFDSSHLFHILEGLILTLLGLILMIYSEKKLNLLSKTKNI